MKKRQGAIQPPIGSTNHNGAKNIIRDEAGSKWQPILNGLPKNSQQYIHFFTLVLIYYVFILSGRVVSGQENSMDVGQDVTTEFDYASRGTKMFGDKCESTLECGFPDSICDSKKRSCQCIEDLPATNHINKCGKEAAINDSCFFNEQCESMNFQTECRDGRCICRFEMQPVVNKDGNIECKGKPESREQERYIDPAMIGILAGMALMFIIICVVLRLFSRARWRENRTIFNTPNPRLMNVSLLRDNKLLHGTERRGSRMSVRMPSRQPSMASLRPHSPNPSLGSRRGSKGSSNASATSTRSNRSNNATTTINNNDHDALNKTVDTKVTAYNLSNIPVIECVTVEITDAKT